MLLDRGQNLAAVQDAARHASPATTWLYDRSRSAYRDTRPTRSTSSYRRRPSDIARE
jgi:hypothetical protein